MSENSSKFELSLFNDAFQQLSSLPPSVICFGAVTAALSPFTGLTRDLSLLRVRLNTLIWYYMSWILGNFYLRSPS